MNLKKKKELIARTLGVGTARIFLDESRLGEIKEAITRQDIRDLKASGIVRIKEARGVKKNEKRKTKKRYGKKKMIVKTRKENYMALTRKLRAQVKEMRAKGKITKEQYYDLRKKIRSSAFKSMTHFMENLS